MNLHTSDKAYRWYKDPSEVQRRCERDGEDPTRAAIEDEDQSRQEGFKELL